MIDMIARHLVDHVNPVFSLHFKSVKLESARVPEVPDLQSLSLSVLI